MLSVVAGQAPITLEWEKYLGKKKQKQQAKSIVHMITVAHLHLRQNIAREVRARTYQMHAVRCTSRHRNRKDHILPRKKVDRMKITTPRRKMEITIEKITHPKGKRQKKSSSQARKQYKARSLGLKTHKRYPGLGNRSIFYPYSPVGNTLSFDVVEDAGSNLTSYVSFIETLARASLKTHISLVPQVLKRSG